MKNGKLFGKLNFIDILVLLVLIAAICVIGYKVLRPAQSKTVGSEVTLSEPNIKFSVMSYDVPLELAQNAEKSISGEPREFGGEIISPNRIYNSGKLIDGEIVACTLTETDKDGFANIRFDVECYSSVSSGAYSLGWQELRLGCTYILKTIDVEFDGTIISMEEIQ